MTGPAERYARLGAIVGEARALHGAELGAYLDATCAGDAALRTEVEELLAVGRAETGAPLAEGELAGARELLAGVLEREVQAWLPETIGDYAVVRLIGRGGMGIVYEAEQRAPRRRVALKLLHPMHATPERLRRFRREAALLGRLQHPGIAQIFEASTYDAGRGPQPFFAMELVDGVDIRTYCERCGLDRAARLALLARVADAVHYAHEREVIHRDLKPDNVLIDAAGNPRVLDFGIARASSSSATLSTLVTEEGQLVGTLAYMAPEQFDRASDAVTRQSDVYALGVLGFELLLGRLPREVEDLSLSKAIALLATTDPPRAHTLDRSLGGDVDTILGKALEADPARRYETAAALAGDIRRHLADRPILARPPSRIYLARKFTRRHRGLVFGTLATFLTLVVGLAVAIHLTGQAQEQRELARANAARAIHGSLQAARTLIDAERPYEAGRQLRLVPEEARGFAWHLVERAAPHLVDGPVGYWSFTDDEHVVTADAGELVVYSLVEQRSRRVPFPGQGVYRVIRATSGGVVTAVTNDDGDGEYEDVMLLDLERGVLLERGPVHKARGEIRSRDILLGPVHHEKETYPLARDRFPEVSDDGRTVLWWTSGSEAEVRVDGAVVRTVSELGVDESARLGPDGRLLVVNRRAEVSGLDLASGEPRFRYACAPGSAASGFPVQGGLLLYSTPDLFVMDISVLGVWASQERVCRRFELEDEGPPLEPADPFESGFTTPLNWKSGQLFSYPRDGRFVAVNECRSGMNGVYLGDPETGAALALAPSTTGPGGLAGWLPQNGFGAIAKVSPSGRRLTLLRRTAEAELVELDPEPPVPTLRGHAGATGKLADGWIYHLAVSNDGSLVATAAPQDPRIRVWDTRTGEELARLERDVGDPWKTNPSSFDALLAFAPGDGRLIATTPFEGSDTQVVEWDLLEGTAEPRSAPVADGLDHHATLLDRFMEVLAPRDGARLSQRVHMQAGEALLVLYQPTFAWSGDPPEPGSRWRQVPGEAGFGSGLAVHPTAPRAAVVQNTESAYGSEAKFVSELRDHTNRLLVVDTRTGAVLVERDLELRPFCVAYSPDGAVLAVGTREGQVVLFETERHLQQLEWTAHDSYVYSLAWTPDGTRLVTVSGDATARIWDTRTRARSRLDAQRWAALRSEMQARDDLDLALEPLAGEELQAARVERIRRARSE